jgi:outer membrane protein TolC
MERELGTQDTYRTDLRLTLPLFTGGRVTAGIRLAEAESRLREALARARHDEVLLSARVEYLRLHQADQLVAAAAASLDRARLVKRDIETLHKAGAVDSTELLEAELVLTSARTALDQATSTRSRQLIRLNLLLGRPVADSIVLTTILPEPDTSLPPVQIPLSKPELATAAASVTVGEHQQTLGRSNWWPVLSLYGGYTFGKPNRDMFSNRFDDYLTAGVNLNWSFNLGNRTSHQVAAARAVTEAARAEYRDMERILNREAHLAREQVLLAFRIYLSVHTRHAIASDNYRLARVRHREGNLPSNRLLEIEAALSATEAELAAAKADVFVAKSVFLFTVGSDDLRKGL